MPETDPPPPSYTLGKPSQPAQPSQAVRLPSTPYTPGESSQPAQPAQPSHDPAVLRGRADRLRKREAELRQAADACGRRALELEASAREMETARVVVPLVPRRRWGRLVIVGRTGDG